MSPVGEDYSKEPIVLNRILGFSKNRRTGQVSVLNSFENLRRPNALGFTLNSFGRFSYGLIKWQNLHELAAYRTIGTMREALRNLRRRKARSALTIFGIAIGIFAFTTMGALAQNLDQTLDNTLDYYTSRVTVSAESAGSAGNGGLLAQGGQVPASLVDRVKVLDGVATAYPTITLAIDNAEVATFSSPPLIYAYRPNDVANDPQKLKLKTGRELADTDTGKVVVGSSVVQGKKTKVGDTIEIREKPFEVIGTLERTGGAPDSFYVITLAEAQEMLRQSNVFSVDAGTLVTDIVVLPKDGVNPDDLARSINEKIRGVSAVPPNEFKKQIEQASTVFNLIIVGSALIALIVGGLSVINTMVMSVAERRKEIGIKRVVGARPRHILKEIIAETALMGLIGGLLGFGLGAALVSVINYYTGQTGVTIFTITPALAGASLAFAFVLGVVAGIYPAYRATRIKPVNVLREE